MRRSDQFDETYFKTGFGPDAYERKEPWLTFYANIVDQIVRSLRPKTVMDAGCALGMVVEAFWDRGVEARGVDISEYAINNVRPDMREHCKVASLTEPFQVRFDLIVCIEVLEHMPADEARAAISNFASATDLVLFSSTPHDFEEITHVNVRPTLSWLKEFMEFGFIPDLTYDASFITPHAILFRKGDALPDETLTLVSEHLRLKHLLQEKSSAFDSSKSALESELTKIRAETIELRKKLASSEHRRHSERDVAHGELQRLESQAEKIRAALNQRAAALEQEKERLHAQTVRLQERIDFLQDRISAVENSTSWRITAPVRSVGQKIPTSITKRIRQVAKAGYWAVTPHRIPQRIEFIRQRNAALSTASPVFHGEQQVEPVPAEPASIAVSYRSSRSLIEDRFSNLAPLPIFKDRSSEKTVTVLTDSVDRNSLFGGVGTALVAGLLLANRLDARFRLATRSNPPDPAVLGTIMRAHHVKFENTVDFAHVPVGQSKPLPMGDDDIMLTTSWWGTNAALGSLSPERIIYILQEDERMFYPHEDMRLKCSELLSDPRLSLLVNTNLLFSHFKDGVEPLANFENRAVAFEPAFPTFPRPRQINRTNDKMNFFFYARPHHARNLYWRGLEIIDGAMRQGVLHPDEWNINFVGHDIEPMDLPGGVHPKVWSKMSWLEYAELVSGMDLGLSLMDTPHPSYPPLDLAAAGATVVTNQHGVKKSLEYWSKNIITAPADTRSMINALKEGVQRAKNSEERYSNCMNDSIERDWEASLGPAIDRLLAIRST